ncbi:MAG: pyruvate kinase [Candidatus Helarchaeota archaeon]
MKLQVIGSLHPEANFLKSVMTYPIVSGIRFNTAIPFKDPKKVVYRLKKKTYPKTLWIDLKCRELRIKEETTIPDNLIILNHKIELKTPAVMYYNEGEKYLIIDEVIDGNKLKIRVPKNVTSDFSIHFGKSASINIPDVIKIHGYMTQNDINYVNAAIENNIHDYMISFVEEASDIESVLELDPEAKIVAKIESQKGIEFIEKQYDQFKDNVTLMVARSDLYIELEHPHSILNVIKLIIEKDPNAIGASRILLSVIKSSDIPNCADICDIGFLLSLGYKTFLLGDQICEDENTLKNALGILKAIQDDFLNS